MKKKNKPTTIVKSQSKNSPHLNTYTEPLPHALNLTKKQISSILAEGIKITDQFTSELKTTVMNEKGDGYFILYQLYFGWFLFEVSVLNLVGEPSEYYQMADEKRTILGEGGFGEVFVGEAYAKVFAIKRMRVFSEKEKVEIWKPEFFQRFHKKLEEAFREVCVIKLLSALGIGPK